MDGYFEGMGIKVVCVGGKAGEGRKQLCIWAGWVTRAIAATTSLRRSLPLAKSLDLEQRPTTTNLLDPATTGHHFPAAIDRIPRTRSASAGAQLPDDVPSNATTVHVLPGARGLPRPNEVALACMTEPLGMFGGSIGARFPKGCQNMCPACVMANCDSATPGQSRFRLMRSVASPLYADSSLHVSDNPVFYDISVYFASPHHFKGKWYSPLLSLCLVRCATPGYGRIPSFPWRHARRLAFR